MSHIQINVTWRARRFEQWADGAKVDGWFNYQFSFLMTWIEFEENPNCSGLGSSLPSWENHFRVPRAWLRDIGPGPSYFRSGPVRQPKAWLIRDDSPSWEYLVGQWLWSNWGRHGSRVPLAAGCWFQHLSFVTFIPLSKPFVIPNNLALQFSCGTCPLRHMIHSQQFKKILFNSYSKYIS